MTILTVIMFAAIGLRLVALVVQAAASRTPLEQPSSGAAIDPCLGPTGWPSWPLTPEGRLVSDLACGAISRRRYQQEMTALAEAEDRAQPFVVPPDQT